MNARERVRDVGRESPGELLDVSRRMSGTKNKDRIAKHPPAFPKLVHDRHGSRVGNRREAAVARSRRAVTGRGDRNRGAFPLASLVGGTPALSRMPKLEPHGDENSCGGNGGALPEVRATTAQGGITAGAASAAEAQRLAGRLYRPPTNSRARARNVARRPCTVSSIGWNHSSGAPSSADAGSTTAVFRLPKLHARDARLPRREERSPSQLR